MIISPLLLFTFVFTFFFFKGLVDLHLFLPFFFLSLSSTWFSPLSSFCSEESSFTTLVWKFPILFHFPTLVWRSYIHWWYTCYLSYLFINNVGRFTFTDDTFASSTTCSNITLKFMILFSRIHWMFADLNKLCSVDSCRFGITYEHGIRFNELNIRHTEILQSKT